MSWVLVLIIYTLIILLYSYFLYKKNYVYYKPFEYINSDTLERVNVHSLYPEFKCLDKISFIHIFFGNFFMAFIKFIINVILAVCQIIKLHQHMKNLKNPTSDPEEWKILSETISFYTRWFLKVNGIKVIRKTLPYEKVYKKYLGEDYSFNPDEKYSLIVSNHTGFYDVLMNMSIHSCGFVAKSDTQDVPLISTIAKGINCLFVKRESPEDREKIFIQLRERQKDFYDGKILSPLCIFPEGTTTNGKYVLKFKKGAFFALLPIKPQIILLDDDVNYSVGIGVSSPAFNYFRSLCYFGCNMYLCELPIIKPTDYMWQNFSHLGNEKWEIYAEVTRAIMCEIGNLKQSEKKFDDSKYYENSLYKGTYETERTYLLFSKV